jgi:hypothetical protein
MITKKETLLCKSDKNGTLIILYTNVVISFIIFILFFFKYYIGVGMPGMGRL